MEITAAKKKQKKRSIMFDKNSDYVIDPHTAVAAGVYKKYLKDTDDHTVDGDCIYSKSVQVHKKRNGCCCR